MSRSRRFRLALAAAPASTLFKAAAVALLLASAHPAGALVYTYENTTSGTVSQAATPCSNPLLRTFAVTDSFTVSEIAIGINISHPRRGDIQATLVAPNGASLQVIAASTNSDDNYDVYITNMAAEAGGTTALNDGDNDPVAAPFYNRLVRLTTMNFYTGNSLGTWTLQVCDNVAANNGTFNRAELTLINTAGTTTSCASRMTYNWRTNGNNQAFTNTTTGNVTLTQSATLDYGGAGTQNTGLPRYNFRTGTNTYSSLVGSYGFYMDADNVVGATADSETIMERSSFTFSSPARDLSFVLADCDWATGDFEDMVRVYGFDNTGADVPFTVTPGTVNQRAGYWVEGDAGSDETAQSTSGTVSYRFEGPVSTLHVDYGQGDEPPAGAGDQWLFMGDFSWCSFDYGDAPASYGSARHVLGYRPLYLGTAVPDGETADQPNASASGDDSTTSPGVDDENAVASFPNYSHPSSTYTVVATANNTSTTTSATLYAYIDWNRDGDFNDAGERSNPVTVPANSVNAAFNVTWTSVPANAGGTTATYARFRLAYSAAEVQNPTGLANSGEVEDYLIPIGTLPVTVAYFQSSERGVEWVTASETANIGFRLLGVGKDRGQGEEFELGRLPSVSTDSQTPRRYRLDVSLEGVRQLWLEEIATDGKTRRHGPYVPGQTFGAEPEESPIDWAAVRQELAAAELDAKNAAPIVGGSFGGARLEVEKPGIQRVTHAALLAQGIDLTGTAIGQIALLDAGAPVARAVVGGPVWNAGSAIEFYFAPKLTLWSPYDVVELRLDASKARAPRTLEAPANGVGGATVAARADFSPNRAYNYGSPNGDPFFDERILAFGAPARIERFFDLPDVVSGGAKVELKMWGVTNWEGSEPDHHVRVRLNGRLVVDRRFDGLTVFEHVLDDPGQLLATGNHLEVELPFDTGYTFDLVHFEGFTVNYKRAAAARGGLLEGMATHRVPVAASGFASPASLWSEGGRALLQPNAGKVFLPVMNANFSLAEASAQHQPRVRAGLPSKPGKAGGNYLVISHPAFANSLGDLISLQAARGYQVSVVTTDAIYAAYSDHAPDPQALQRFVASLGRSVEFVLLVGGASYDPYNYLGLGSVSFVPTFYNRVNEFVAFGPTDELVVDRDGDSLPDLPIGRLPVRTQGELQAVLDKMWAWQNGLAPRQALVSSGLSNAGSSRELEGISESYRSALGNSWTTVTAAVDQSGTAAVRSSVLDAFAQGVPLISYVGHSAFGQWDFTPVLRWQDVAGLGYGGRPSVVLQWGCWNGYYASPEYDTLSNHLLLQPTVGAVATVGSSNLTSTAAHQGLGSRFLERVAAGDATVGEALLHAKRALYTSDPNTLDAVWGQVLLGDPATPLP